MTALDAQVLQYLSLESDKEVNKENYLLLLQSFLKNIDKYATSFIKEKGIIKLIHFLNKYENLDTQFLEALFRMLKLLTQTKEGEKEFSNLNTETATHLISLFYSNFNNQILVYETFSQTTEIKEVSTLFANIENFLSILSNTLEHPKMKPVAIKTLANIAMNDHFEFFVDEETFTQILKCDHYLTLDIFIAIFQYIESLGETKDYSNLTNILFVNEGTKELTMNLISIAWDEGHERAKILVDLWENNKFIFGEETKLVFKQLKQCVLEQLDEQRKAMKN